jgi:hypothetical protein
LKCDILILRKNAAIQTLLFFPPVEYERAACGTRAVLFVPGGAEEGDEVMARPRKIQSAKKLAEKWAEYKDYCDNRKVLVHDFSSKNSEFVSAELKKSVTYTIEGFCVYIGLSRQCFYDYYDKDERFADIVTRIREECETDAREKFELGVIPSQLAGLWMSKYGYSTKQNMAAELSAGKELPKLYEALTGDDK